MKKEFNKSIKAIVTNDVVNGKVEAITFDDEVDYTISYKKYNYTTSYEQYLNANPTKKIKVDTVGAFHIDFLGRIACVKIGADDSTSK
jgi:hypothetical protein